MATTETPLLSKDEASSSTSTKSYNDQTTKDAPKPNTSRATRVLTKLFGEVASVRDIVANNITALERRGQDLETLDEKINDMQSGANKFKVTTESIRDREQKKNRNLKKTLVICTFILILAVVIFILVMLLLNK